MIELDKLSKCVKSRLNRAEATKQLLNRKKEKSFFIENEIIELSETLLVIQLLSNDKSLQISECESCGSDFIKKNSKQNVCSNTCRSKLHRLKKLNSNN